MHRDNFLYFLDDSYSKQPLFSYTSFTDWSLWWKHTVFSVRREQNLCINKNNVDWFILQRVNVLHSSNRQCCKIQNKNIICFVSFQSSSLEYLHKLYTWIIIWISSLYSPLYFTMILKFYFQLLKIWVSYLLLHVFTSDCMHHVICYGTCISSHHRVLLTTHKLCLSISSSTN